MFLRRARRIGRVFAMVLLAWTAVDLIDRRACQNQPQWLPIAEAALRVGPVTGPLDGDSHQHDPMAGHHGDCFCCSSFVDVKLPFELAVSATVAWLHPSPTPAYSSASSPHLYRPPIFQ